jgi:nucleoside-diphosphate-sugar epimerase
MNIAMIGGAGFIGTRLAKRLNDSGSDFTIYDKNRSSSDKIIELDIENTKSLSKIMNCDTIINLAAVHRDDIEPKSRYDDVNVQGSRNICNAARKYGINKIIFTSSVAIYGFAPADTTESGKPNYFNDYGRTKFIAEQVFNDWQSEDPQNRTLVIIRPTVVFGEGNRGNVYNLFKQIASGMFVMIGDGKNKKSMAYVENIAAFIQHTLSFRPGIHVYNYIDKPDLDMNTLISFARNVLLGKNNIGLRLPGFVAIGLGYIVDLASKISGKKFPVSSIRIKKFLATTQFSSSIQNTEFIAPVSLQDGINKTLNYEFVEDNSNKRTFETE